MPRRRSLTLVPAILAAGVLTLAACGEQVPGGMPEEGQQSGQVEVAGGAGDDGSGDGGNDDADVDATGGSVAGDGDGDGDVATGGGDDDLDGAAPGDPIVVQTGDDEFETNMAIYRRYDDAKGGPMALLAPVAEAEDLAGGTMQEYRGGTIFWTPDTGAQIVRGQILDTYLDHGGPAGELGWPVGDETEEEEVTFSDFQHGQIRLEDSAISVLVREG